LGPTGFALHQNYPNPFNESTILSFTLAQPGEVRVSVFDAIGSLIASIYHGKSPAGLNSIQFNPQGLSSGTYFLEMSVDRKSSQIRKMVLLK
jgi:hypothetical protein